MGLEEFQSGGSSDSGDSGSSSTSRPSGNTRVSDRWQTRVDFSKAYVIVAQDRQGNLYTHEGTLAVLDDNLDWRRLGEHPNKEFDVLYRCTERSSWLRFCNRAQDQLDVDVREVLQEDPARIPEIRERVYYPPHSKPDQTRECRICGTSGESNETTLMEVDLQGNRKVPLCTHHTVEEMAYEGLLS